MNRKILLAAIAALLTAGLVFIACKKENTNTTLTDNGTAHASKMQKDLYTGWLLQFFVKQEEDGYCYYYYRCTGVTYSNEIQCNPSNPQTLGFQVYPMCGSDGQQIKVRCDDLSVALDNNDTTTIDNPSDFEPIQQAIRQMYEDGLLLTIPDDYIYGEY